MLAFLLAVSGVLAAPAVQAAQASGETVYGKYCTTCHDATDGRAPTRAALKQMSPARILRTLDFGLMMSIAYPIRREDREAVAKFLGGAADEAPIPREAFCKADHPIMPAVSQANWNGWSPGQTNMRYQSAAAAGLNVADIGKLQLKWAFGFPGDVTAFGAPTVLNGTVFVGSAGGGAYAIDAKSGCLHWMFQAGGPVRSALVAVQNGTGYSLIFGDQNGGVYALDAKTGKQLWTKRVEPHEAARLTASPAVENGVVFVPAASWEETRSVDPEYPCCTFRGSVTRAQCQGWFDRLADVPCRSAEEDRRDQDRHRNLWALGRGRLVHADGRCKTRHALPHDGRQLLAPRDLDQRRVRGARSEDRTHCLVDADFPQGCLQFLLWREGRELSRRERTGL